MYFYQYSLHKLVLAVRVITRAVFSIYQSDGLLIRLSVGKLWYVDLEILGCAGLFFTRETINRSTSLSVIQSPIVR